jgi:hypothetical protein
MPLLVRTRRGLPVVGGIERNFFAAALAVAAATAQIVLGRDGVTETTMVRGRTVVGGNYSTA